MGYLDNSIITVDAILTKKGRELLAKNNNSFDITHFALGDDEIDYNLYNENHPNGSQYAGEAIENMVLTEAIPDENNILKSKLINLQPPMSVIPYVELGGSASTTILDTHLNQTPEITAITHNMTSQGTVGAGEKIEQTYIWRIGDARLFSLIKGDGGPDASTATLGTGAPINPFSATVQGTRLILNVIGTQSVFGSNSGLITTLTCTSAGTGATVTIPVYVGTSSGGNIATYVPSSYLVA